MQWWVIVVIVYMLVGILISRTVVQPSSIADAMLFTLIWALFWPLMLLLLVAITRISRDPDDGARHP